jgi:hypothetical protein
MAPELLDDSSHGFVVAGEELVGLGDRFQAMEVDRYGDVTIWGVHHVYRLQRWYGIEKLIFLPRHPPSATAGPDE